MFNTTTVSYHTVLKRAKLTTLQDILILMFKVKKKDELAMNFVADIFNIKEEDTNGKRYNLRNADLMEKHTL